MENEKEQEKVEELGTRLKDSEPLQDDPGFDLSPQTLRRYLIARDWILHAAEKLLRGTIAYRRTHRPQDVECKWCHAHPGYHSIRQVGFDRQGRPVIYSSFTQVWTQNNHVDDTIAHFLYLLENVQRCMGEGVYQLVWILDVTGLTMSACNPRLAYGVSQVLSNHYPERLGLAYVINHSVVMHALWKACAIVVPAASRNKTHVLRGKHNIEEAFSAVFSDELKNWIYEETRLNKQHPIPDSQKTFWKRPPDGVEHDPRGCPSYVRDYIEQFSVEEYKTNKYVCKPHPNIMDTIMQPREIPDNNNVVVNVDVDVD